MSRFRQANDGAIPFSEIKPERFGPEPYVAPSADGEGRDIDNAPELTDERSIFANVAYRNMKGR